MNDASGNTELHDHYAEQVNLAVAEGRDDIIDTLTARFAAANAQRPPGQRRRRPSASPI